MFLKKKKPVKIENHFDALENVFRGINVLLFFQDYNPFSRDFQVCACRTIDVRLNPIKKLFVDEQSRLCVGEKIVDDEDKRSVNLILMLFAAKRILMITLMVAPKFRRAHTNSILKTHVARILPRDLGGGVRITGPFSLTSPNFTPIPPSSPDR